MSMTKLKISLFGMGAGVALALAATAASADGYVRGGLKDAPCCDNWSGRYFGAYFGAGAGTNDTSFTDRQTQTFRQTVPGTTVTQVFTDVGSGALSGDVTGSVVDLFAGYNFHQGCCSKFVFGAQFEGTVFSDITLKSSGRRNSVQTQTTTTNVGGVITVTTASATASSTFDNHDELRSMFALVGRAGFLATPHMLFYGLAGATIGNFVIPDSQDPRGGDRSQWEFGYTVGAGLEHKLNQHWSIRAEYRYVHFEVDRSASSSDSQTQVTGATTFTNDNTFTRSLSTDVDFHLGKIGIVYRF
jgi:opacity protein-like surface antigen